MTLEQSLDSSNNTNIMTNHNMPGWSTAQKMSNDVHHAARMDKKAEIEHSNLINHQNWSAQAALDELNHNRTFNRLMMMVGANKLLNLDTEDSIAMSEAMKGSSNSAMLSQLSQLVAASIGNKTAAITPPETGVAAQMANFNALNAQNYQNQAASSALANALTASATALAGIVNKTFTNVPPVGSYPIQQPQAAPQV